MSNHWNNQVSIIKVIGTQHHIQILQQDSVIFFYFFSFCFHHRNLIKQASKQRHPTFSSWQVKYSWKGWHFRAGFRSRSGHLSRFSTTRGGYPQLQSGWGLRFQRWMNNTAGESGDCMWEEGLPLLIWPFGPSTCLGFCCQCIFLKPSRSTTLKGTRVKSDNILQLQVVILCIFFIIIFMFSPFL